MSTPPIHWERFTGPAPGLPLAWHHEPARWSLDGGLLRIEPDAQTDFWQRTHYGFQADNGHLLYTPVAGDFVMTTHVSCEPLHQYDQAGLMVRLSESCWLKTSVEHEPGAQGRLGAVVTNHGYSDWSTQAYAGRQVWLRIRREGSDYTVEWSADGSVWEQLRLAHLCEDDGGRVACGAYACCPKAAGLVAVISRLDITAGRAS